jgi:hypothetical protein
MKSDIIRTLTGTFEGHLQQTEGADHFADVGKMVDVAPAAACEVSRQAISDHLVDVNKMVDLSSGN